MSLSHQNADLEIPHSCRVIWNSVAVPPLSHVTSHSPVTLNSASWTSCQYATLCPPVPLSSTSHLYAYSRSVGRYPLPLSRSCSRLLPNGLFHVLLYFADV
ncbi:hypothetical protein M404DRAFT_995498 [Pisolithus tinctorius Marx 270]|uniref:Uncharacterized protein n=1 Tax=Pisolithus tinctorius Marx 270 TaxID=870435 RepID=A0A0C3JMC1_PISTI|nr:hypothetical protein M404DRAFT_995498 [Pisolithus tinctorius Marx 270]